MRPRLLDAYCCQGGASKGYADAGWDVVGIDIEPQPRYPYPFIEGDVLDVLARLLRGEGITASDGRTYYLDDFDGFHASPPCRSRTKAQKLRGNEHPALIGRTRELLEQTGRPYVIENVPTEGDDTDPLRDPVMLCGTMFGLRLYRHRLFETNWPLTPPLHGQHYLRQVKMGRKPGPDDILQPVGNFSGVQEAREAMEMPWASQQGLREAIPPAYACYIGELLRLHIEAPQELAA